MILRIAVVVLAAASAAWLWTVLFPSPQKIIRHRLDQIARTASFNGDENPLVTAGKAQKLAGFVSTNVEVKLDGMGGESRTFSGRDEVLQAAAGAHGATRALTVQFLDPEVTVAVDKQSATVNLTLKAWVEGEKDFIVQQMAFTFRKIDGDWVITRIETVRALS